MEQCLISAKTFRRVFQRERFYYHTRQNVIKRIFHVVTVNKRYDNPILTHYMIAILKYTARPYILYILEQRVDYKLAK